MYENGDKSQVEAPLKNGHMFKEWKVNYFNKAFYPKDFKDYDINYSYYEIKAKEWISAIQQKEQLTLNY